MATPAGEEALDAAVGEAALDGELLGHLHFDIVAGGEMEPAAHRLLALRLGVEEGQHLPAGIHRCAEMVDDRGDQGLGQIIERRPQKHHVEHAPGKIERVVQVAFDVPDWVAVFVGAGDPVFAKGIDFKVGEEDAVTEVR